MEQGSQFDVLWDTAGVHTCPGCHCGLISMTKPSRRASAIAITCGQDTVLLTAFFDGVLEFIGISTFKGQ